MRAKKLLDIVTLCRKHPCVFNGFYKLRQRVETGWHSLKSIADDITRNRTNHKSGDLVRNSFAIISYGQLEEDMDFKSKPLLQVKA